MNTPLFYWKGRVAFWIEEMKITSTRKQRLQVYSDVAAALVAIDAYFTGVENLFFTPHVVSLLLFAVVSDCVLLKGFYRNSYSEIYHLKNKA